MSKQTWRLEFSFQTLSLAISFDCDVSVLVVPQRGAKKECDLVSFCHRRQPIVLDRKLTMEVETVEERPFLLTLKVLVRAKGTKKCAGEVELQLQEQLRSPSFNFRFNSPLSKCPDKKASLAFEFRYLPAGSPAPLSEAVSRFVFPTLHGCKRDDSTNSSGRLRSASPSNVHVFFNRAAGDASHRSFNLSSLAGRSQNLSLSSRDVSDTRTAAARATFPPQRVVPSLIAKEGGLVRPPPPLPGSAMVILDQSVELSPELSPRPCVCVSDELASRPSSDVGSEAVRLRAQLAEREEELRAMRMQGEDDVRLLGELRVEAAEQRLRLEKATNALRAAEERFESQTFSSHAQLAAAAEAQREACEEKAALEAAVRRLETQGFEVRAHHAREESELREKLCRVEYEMQKAFEEKEHELLLVREGQTRLGDEKKTAVNALKAELAQKMGVCSCSQNSLSDLTVEDFAQQLRNVEARNEALKGDLEGIRAAKVGVEQRLALCESDRDRLLADARERIAQERAEVERLSRELQEEKEKNEILLEERERANSAESESSEQLPTLHEQIKKLQTALDSAQSHGSEVAAQLRSVKSETESLRAQLSQNEVDSDEYSLLISENDTLKKKMRTLEHKVDEGLAKAAKLKQLEKALEQKSLELDRNREDGFNAINALKNELEEMKAKLDVRKSPEFLNMEKKYIEYVQKMSDVLNLVQSSKINKDHQQAIIKLLI